MPEPRVRRAGPRPVRPHRVRVRGNGRRVALADDDLVALAADHQRGHETADLSTHDHDPGHATPPTDGDKATPPITAPPVAELYMWAPYGRLNVIAAGRSLRTMVG